MEGITEAELDGYDRKTLQGLCKAVGIRANGKTAFMREELRSKIIVCGAAAEEEDEVPTRVSPELDDLLKSPPPASHTTTTAAAAAAAAAAPNTTPPPPQRRPTVQSATQPFNPTPQAKQAEEDDADNNTHHTDAAATIARQHAEIIAAEHTVAALEADLRQANSSNARMTQQLKQAKTREEELESKIAQMKEMHSNALAEAEFFTQAKVTAKLQATTQAEKAKMRAESQARIARKIAAAKSGSSVGASGGGGSKTPGGNPQSQRWKFMAEREMGVGRENQYHSQHSIAQCPLTCSPKTKQRRVLIDADASSPNISAGGGGSAGGRGGLACPATGPRNNPFEKKSKLAQTPQTQRKKANAQQKRRHVQSQQQSQGYSEPPAMSSGFLFG